MDGENDIDASRAVGSGFLTSDQVRDKVFKTKRFGGYDERQVDALLDDVRATLERYERMTSSD